MAMSRSNLNVQLPPPVVFGAPARFTHWRDLQSAAILAATESDKRFILQAAPTGFGKSLVYIGQALLTGARACILTSTKGLQSQLLEDFGESGLVDIRGLGNYPCHNAEDGKTRTCAEGQGFQFCSPFSQDCSYYRAYRKAKEARLVVTNYANWMAIRRYRVDKSGGGDDAQERKGLGKFDLLIMDEGHNAPDELSDFMKVEMTRFDIESTMRAEPMQDGASIDDWRRWAVHHAPIMERRIDELRARIQERRESGSSPDRALMREALELNQVLGKVQTLAEIKDEWVVEARGGKHWQFDPVWPAQYAERWLFQQVPKVVIFSATIRPKTAEILGIKKDNCDFNEYPSSFPVSRRPIYSVPTLQMNHRTNADEGQMRKWVNRIDQIVGKRLDRKGVIHTVSFDRRNLIMQNSEHSDIMIANDSHNTRTVVERFKQASAPAVLVSPSLTTGWDFPGDHCRYVIVGKLPFIDRRPLIMQARCKSDKDYDTYLTAQMLVQETGRGMRADDDWCECIVIDDNFRWFVPTNSKFFPRWWLDSINWKVKTIPPPLEPG